MQVSPSSIGAAAVTPARDPWALLVPLSLAGFLLIGGMLTSLSVYVSVMQRQMGWGAAQAGAGPVALLVGMSTGNLLISPAMRKLGLNGTFAIGCALAAIAWGVAGLSSTLVAFSMCMVIAGLGCGLATIVPGIATLTHAFHARRGLAIALFIGSCSIASSTMPMATNLLLEKVTWQTAFQLGGFVALLLVPVLWWTLPKHAEGQPISKLEALRKEGLSQKQAFQLPAFWILTLVLTFSMVCMNGVLFNIVAYLQDLDMPAVDAVALYSLTNFMSLPGLLLGGYLSDRVRVQIMFPSVLLIQGMGTLALLSMSGTSLLGTVATGAFVILWGGVAGLPAQSGSLMLNEIVGSRAFAALLAVVFTVNGFIGAFAPAFTGWLRDTTGDYRAAFALFSVMMIGSALAAIWCRQPSQRHLTVLS